MTCCTGNCNQGRDCPAAPAASLAALGLHRVHLVQCERADRIEHGLSDAPCGSCVNGICASALACHRPVDPEPRTVLRFPSGRGLLIGAGLSIGGCVLFLARCAA